ncbi:MAG: hypothetical protein AAGF60_14615 [Pseudomonadota bacterium]
MQTVTQLELKEPIRVNRERLGDLYTQLGEHSAEDVVCRAMEEVSLRMTHCDRAFRARDWADLRKSARSLIAIADQIGMQDVGRVAADVVACIDRQDHVATAATLGRLMRAGEGSLSAVWDLQDLTI